MLVVRGAGLLSLGHKWHMGREDCKNVVFCNVG